MKQKSFTLIELLVVIIIIGILASVIIISTSSSISKANFAKAKAFSANIKDSMFLDLVSEWTFDEGSGTIGETAGASDVKDTWGINHGDINGHAPTLKGGSDCVFGKCLEFDGEDDYLRISSFNGLKNQSQTTISFWTKDDVSAGLRYILWAPSNVLIGCDDLNLRVRWYLEGAWRNDHIVNNILKKDVWSFYVITFDSGNTIINKNGTEVLSESDTQKNIGDYATNYDFGLRGSQYFKGKIDDIRIHNMALSSSQIKQNYLLGLNSLLAKGSISKQEYNQRINDLSSANISPSLP